MTSPYATPQTNPIAVVEGSDSISSTITGKLRASRPWIVFIVATLLFGAGAMLLFSAALSAPTPGGNMPDSVLNSMRGMAIFLTVMSALCITLAIQLIKYVSCIRLLLDQPTEENLGNTLDRLHNLWKAAAISIGLIGLSILIYIGSVVANVATLISSV